MKNIRRDYLTMSCSIVLNGRQHMNFSTKQNVKSNVPRYPDLSTFPNHKHEDDRIIEAKPPDLSEVLAEIDAIIYGNRTD